MRTSPLIFAAPLCFGAPTASPVREQAGTSGQESSPGFGLSRDETGSSAIGLVLASAFGQQKRQAELK